MKRPVEAGGARLPLGRQRALNLAHELIRKAGVDATTPLINTAIEP